MRVRFFAAAAEAAGVPETTSSAATLDGLRSELISTYGPDFANVLAQCSYFVDGSRHGRDAQASLAGVELVDVLPPFAGG